MEVRLNALEQAQKEAREQEKAARRQAEVARDELERFRHSNALPQLIKHGTEPYHLHATSLESPLATRMAVEAAMAFVDVVRSGELSRLRICEYPGCGDVVVDLSKNRSKRFCDGGCGNRAAVAAYRARKSGVASA